MRSVEEAKAFFKDDKWATEAAEIDIDKADGYDVACSMKIQPKHKNALGGVMGGAIYTLADFAFAVATNGTDYHTVTTTTTANFLGTAKGDALIARTKLIKDGRRTCLVDIEIRDDLDNLVAVVSCNGMHV